MTHFNINPFEFSGNDFDDEFSKDTLRISKLFVNSNRELKKAKQEKESLINQLFESHILIDSLKSEITMLFNIVDPLENKLKDSEDLFENFSSNNLKSMLCI
jgi:predicted  nucleic acid-binding Zn-ribbon protein